MDAGPSSPRRKLMKYACKSFLSEAEGITDPGQVYTWIRTAALRYLNREANRRRREIPIDPVTMEKGRVVEDPAGSRNETMDGGHGARGLRVLVPVRRWVPLRARSR